MQNKQDARKALLQQVRDDRIFLNNPVMFQGLGLAPLVVADTTCKNAVMLIVALLLLMIPTRVITVMILYNTGNRGRTVMYPFVAALVYIPVYLLMSIFWGTDLLLLGVYLPVLVADPLVISRAERTRLESLSNALGQGVNTAFGASIVIFLMAAIREFLAFGTLFGVKVYHGSTALMPLAGHPAGGFILLGLVCAIWRYAANNRKKRLSMEVVWK